MMLNMFLYPLTRLEMVSSRTDCDLHRLTIFTTEHPHITEGVEGPEFCQRPHIRFGWRLSFSVFGILGSVLSLLFAGRSLEISSICSGVFVPPVTSECSQLPRLVVGNVMDPCHGNVVVFNVMHPQDHQKWVG